MKVMRKSSFGTWYRKLCEEPGLEDSIISNKTRMGHLASDTVLVWLVIAVNWWNRNSLEKLDLMARLMSSTIISWYGLK